MPVRRCPYCHEYAQAHRWDCPVVQEAIKRARAAKVAAEPAHWPASKINEKPSLPTDSAVRKGLPVTTGVLQYFPRALAYVAKVSKTGNDKHNPGQPLHWSKEKSTDHLDCCGRHLADAGKRGDAGLRESGYLAWRALANLEIELEAAEARGEEL